VEQYEMRGIAIVVCVVVAAYAVDKIGLNGKYSRALTQITERAWHHLVR
jgi:hypothetical protein